MYGRYMIIALSIHGRYRVIALRIDGRWGVDIVLRKKYSASYFSAYKYCRKTGGHVLTTVFGLQRKNPSSPMAQARSNEHKSPGERPQQLTLPGGAREAAWPPLASSRVQVPPGGGPREGTISWRDPLPGSGVRALPVVFRVAIHCLDFVRWLSRVVAAMPSLNQSQKQG